MLPVVREKGKKTGYLFNYYIYICCEKVKGSVELKMFLSEAKSSLPFDMLTTEHLLVGICLHKGALQALSFLHSQLIVILFTAIPGAHSRTLVGLLFVFLLCLRCDAYLLKFCCFAFAFLTIFALNALFKLAGEQNFFIRGEVFLFFFFVFFCRLCAVLSAWLVRN